MPHIYKTSIFLLLLLPLLFTACYEDKPIKPKKVLLEGNASEENHYLAQKHFIEGEYEKALEFDLKQLKEDLKYYEDISLEISLDYNNIGLDYDELKNHEKALIYYLKAMKIDEIVLKKNSTERSSTFYNVASAYDGLENYSHAIEYYLKALAIDEILFRRTHKNLLAEYESLAVAYEKTSQLNLALKYWHKTLNFKEEAYGKSDLDTNETRKKVEELEEKLRKKS